MTAAVSRREVLEKIGKAGASVLLGGGVLRGENSDIVIGGQFVEIVVRSLSPSTVRISVVPMEGRAIDVGNYDALVGENRWRLIASRRRYDSFGSIRAGHLVVRFTPNPPTIHIDTAQGQHVQRLTFSTTAKPV